MKVVIIGPRGAGKSAVAKATRFALGFPVTSTDFEIEQQAGCSIADLVAKEGWDGFRTREADVIANLDDPDETIIDCGGGAVMNPASRAKLLEGETTVVYLTASIDTLKARIGADGNRPALTGSGSAADEIEAVLKERAPVYEEMATHTFSTDDMSAEDIAEEIRDLVENAA